MVINFIDYIGSYFLRLINTISLFVYFLFRTILTLFTSKLKIKQVIIQLKHSGAESFSIIFLTGFSAGFALALQFYIGLNKFGGEELIGLFVATAMTRELGPVLTGIMITGRIGSAMAAEIGTMKITEQIDALKTLRINPYQYLIVPRVVATTLALPLLTNISILFGLLGGYIYSTFIVNLNPEIYLSTIEVHVVIWDIIGGIIKSAFFGFIISIISSFMGFYTKGGARDVGYATTKSVVIGSILILIANYFLSLLLFRTA